MADKRTFRILRFDPISGQPPKFDTFEVPWRKGQTVLDALNHIQGHIDGSVAYRSSCRAGVCGSCAMHINGRYRLACETQVALLTSPITLRPLGHLPVIRDLVVDMAPFWAKYKSIHPYLIAGDAAPERERIQSPADREHLTGIVDCILCAACHAACPMTDADPAYLGPAVLAKQNRFVVDTRDGHAEERLSFVGDEHGVFRCHTAFNCSDVCPKDIDPAGSIAHLKRMFLGRKLLHFKRT